MNETPHITLPAGTILTGDGDKDRYEILDPQGSTGPLGQGGFGITYLAQDHKLKRRVAIKEFFPHGIVSRGHTLTVTSHDAPQFETLKKYFLGEARTLAGFSDPRIVPIWDFFEANNTAYMVMPYLQGEKLSDRYKRSPYTEAEARALLTHLIEALKVVHGANVLHRDIKPDNIIFTERPENAPDDADPGLPIYIDFGSARAADDPDLARHTRSTIGAYSPHFSPIELNSTDTKKTPATDIYALGATIYRVMFLSGPPDSAYRFSHDETELPDLDQAVLTGKVTPNFAKTLKTCLQLRAKDRFHSLDDLRAALAEKETVLVSDPTPPPTPEPEVETTQPTKSRLPLFAAIALALGLGGAWAGGLFAPASPPIEIIATPDITPSVETLSPAQEIWNSFQGDATPQDLRAFIAEFPDDPLAEAAAEQLAVFEQEDADRIAQQEADRRAAQTAEAERTEDAAWASARESATTDSFLAYLEAYPNGRFSADAHAEIERIKNTEIERLSGLQAQDDAAWQAARDDGTKQALQSYLDAFPNGQHTDEATAAIAGVERAAQDALKTETDLWAIARTERTIETYNAYLSAFPDGFFAAAAAAGIALLEREEADRLAALVQAENDLWSDAQSERTFESYNTYLETYPDGRFVTNAAAGIARLEREEADRLAAQAALKEETDLWASVRSERTLEGYSAYLSAYPDGVFAAFATEAVARLEREEAERLAAQPTLQNPHWIRLITANGRDEAIALVGDYQANFTNIQVFEATTGFFKITLGPYARADANAAMARFKSSGLIPQVAHVTPDLDPDNLITLTTATAPPPALRPSLLTPEMRAQRSVRQTAFTAAQTSSDPAEALTQIIATYPGTNEAFLAQRLLNRANGSITSGPIQADQQSADSDHQRELIQRCDELAGSGFFADELGSIPTVVFANFTDEALPACAAAAQAAPQNQRILHQYGRTLSQADRQIDAIPVYITACNLGSAGSCANVGAILRRNGPARNLVHANTLLRTGCNLNEGLGSGASCQNLGHLYANSEFSEYNQSTALGFFERGCALGDDNACANIGYSHFARDLPNPDMRVAEFRLKEGCEANQTWACAEAGKLYSGDYLGRPNLAAAVQYYRLGCDQQSANSCNRLGHLYLNDDYSGKNDQTALGFFETGCALNNVNSCGNIGYLHLTGDISNRDHDIAETRLTEACWASTGWACRELAKGFRFGGADGRFGPIDLGRAAFWYKEACRNGDRRSCEERATVEFDLGNADGFIEAAQTSCNEGFQEHCAVVGLLLHERGDRSYGVELMMRSLRLDSVGVDASGNQIFSSGSPALIEGIGQSSARYGGIFDLSPREMTAIRRDIQIELRDLGFYNDTIDGVFGPNMRRAMENYCGCTL